MRIDGQIVGFRAVAFEKTCEALPRIHDFQIARVVDQLLVLVRRWRGGRYELVGHALEFVKECLICLAAKGAKDGGFVERRAREVLRRDVAVAHALIVRDHQPAARRAHFCHVAHIDGRFHAQEVYGIAHELLFDAERADDEQPPALVLMNQAAPFELHDGFPQSEGGEDRPPPALCRP